MKRNLLLLLLAFLLIWAPAVRAEDDLIPIYTAAQLQAMEPEGSYILMEDIDLAGIAWTPVDFSGSLDGNGHAILNLTLTEPSARTAKCYDGNSKSYEPAYYGLFGLLENARIGNLHLVNVRCCIEAEGSVIIGSLAGYASHSRIENCSATATLELRAHTGMFGLGGLVGYGTGSIENCAVNTQLICVDTNAREKDEQFLGGVYAAGFLDVRRCTVTVDGWVSEHGYTHNGGITGLFMRYPIGDGIDGEIKGNHVEGKITFFEDNPDRRAYCKAYAGEVLGRYCTIEANTNNFTRDEIWDYSKELRPHSCETPVWTEEVIPSGCDSFGYTRFTCACGYSYADRYTLFSHTVTAWETMLPATEASEGTSRGKCDLCGLEQQRTDPALPPQPTAEPTQAPSATVPAPEPTTEAAPEIRPTEPEAEEPTKKPDLPLLWLLPAALAVALLILLLPRKKGKYEK